MIVMEFEIDQDLYDKVNVILAKQSVLEKQLQIENHTNGKPKQE